MTQMEVDVDRMHIKKVRFLGLCYYKIVTKMLSAAPVTILANGDTQGFIFCFPSWAMCMEWSVLAAFHQG